MTVVVLAKAQLLVCLNVVLAADVLNSAVVLCISMTFCRSLSSWVHILFFFSHFVLLSDHLRNFKFHLGSLLLA